MSDSAPKSNNVNLKFRGKAEMERPRMPATSQAMAKAMFAAKAGKSTLGIPKSVGEEFTQDFGPDDVKALPKRKNKRAERLRLGGRISDKQIAKLARDTDKDGA